MNKENVKVIIKGLHANEDESADIGMEALGKYYLKNGKQYILYEEKSKEGEISKSTIKIDEGIVEVIKKGVSQMHLIFSEGKVNNTYLSTIAGKIFVGVKTEKLIIKDDADRININIEYSLLIDEEKVSDCKVEIIITE